MSSSLNQAGLRPVAIAAALLLASPAQAQQQQQVVKPPQAQAWIDIATFSGLGMPSMGAGGAGANPMAAMMGSLFGGSGAKNSFGNTQGGAAGRWVDVTLSARANPQLAEAQQSVPAGFLSPALTLQAPENAPRTAPDTPDEREVPPPDYERPKGRILMYWGCGAAVRPGQPRVLDMATATPADFGKFFVSRRATQRGTHLAPGRPVWPSRADTRMVPAQASLVGEHAFSGNGVPAEFRFNIPPAQDLMPAIQLKQQALDGGAVELGWNALPTARAFFAAAMGGGASESDMVVWTSSELPENGFGLIDYQTNAAVDRWLKEKVLLSPETTRCVVPQGVFKGQGAMLRLIAYGSELNLAHPPRPADPKIAWEPVWAAKLRVKSVASGMLGMEMMDAAGTPPDGGSPQQQQQQQPAPEKDNKPKLKPADLLRGILGR
jgi:hypothetical protein